MEPAKKIDSLSRIGFSLFLLVDILCFYSSTAFSGIERFDTAAKDVYVVVLIGARIVAYVVTFFATRKRSPLEINKKLLAFACIGTGCIGLISVIHGAENSSVLFLVAGSLLFGAGQGVVGLFWLSTLVSFSYRSSYLYLIGSHALATVLCALLLFVLPKEAILIAVFILLIGGNLFIVFTPHSNQSRHTVQSQLKDLIPRLGKGVLAVCVFALASGFVVALSGKAHSVVDPIAEQYGVLVISGVVLIILLVPALVFKQPLEIESGYKVALPLSALGFLILPGLIDFIPPSISGTLVTTGYMMTGIILSCTIAEVARTARVPGLPLFAGTEVFPLSFFLCGIVFGSFLANRITGFSVELALIGAGSLYLIVLSASWVFTKERVKDVDATKRDTEDKIPLEMLAESKGLSQLEEGILEQLVEGRTIPWIAKEQYLSASSVKYHTQKIYRAFDVHSRIELVEKVVRDQGRFEQP